MIREIVLIDEEKCDGCGLCVPSCAEGAIQIINGKAKLLGERLCDGLGACLGHCPQGAITIEKREAEMYDEELVHMHLENLAKQEKLGSLTAGSKFNILPSMSERPTLAEIRGFSKSGGCPGSRYASLECDSTESHGETGETAPSELRQWPVKLRLLPPTAPVLNEAKLLVAADCAAFACGDFHRQLLKGAATVIACPKLDNTEGYVEKLAEILARNEIPEVIVSRMEVPCCSRLTQFVLAARELAGVRTPIREAIVSVDGEIEFRECS